MNRKQQQNIPTLSFLILFSSLILQVSSQNGFSQYFGTCINERTRDTSNPMAIRGVVVTLTSVINETLIYNAVSDNDGIFIFLDAFGEEDGDAYIQTLTRDGYEREVTVISITNDNGTTWGLNKENDFEPLFLLLILILMPLFGLICCGVIVAKRINRRKSDENLSRTLKNMEIRPEDMKEEEGNNDTEVEVGMEVDRNILLDMRMEMGEIVKEGKMEKE